MAYFCWIYSAVEIQLYLNVPIPILKCLLFISFYWRQQLIYFFKSPSWCEYVVPFFVSCTAGKCFFFLCLICLTELQEKETKTAQCCSFSSVGACNHIGYRQLLNVSYNILCCTYILFCLLYLHGKNNLDLHIISVLLSSLLDQALYQRSARLSAVRSLFKFFYSAK